MIKGLLIKIGSKRLGWLLSLVTAMVAGFVVQLLARIGMDLPPEKMAEITISIGGFIYIIFQAILLKVQFNGSEKFQKELKKLDPTLAQDRWLGDATIKVLKDAVEARADRNKDIPKAIPADEE